MIDILQPSVFSLNAWVVTNKKGINVEEEIILKISSDMYNKLMERAEISGFSKIEDYIKLILEEIISSKKDSSYNTEDEEKVKQRLRDLGYIDWLSGIYKIGYLTYKC